MTFRGQVKRHVPWFVHYLYRKFYYAPLDVPAALGLVFHSTKSPTRFFDRLKLVISFYKISYYVDCPHTEHEFFTIAQRILNLGPSISGVIAEAGVFHGGSTAKLSLVARLCDREIDAFDSFEGMPENNEVHGKSIYGREHRFPKGSHAVGLDEVRRNIAKYGDLSRADLHKGFFDVTMPGFKRPVSIACINVDLVQSTKDCLRFLYPLVSPGGLIVSQDGHFPWIIKLLGDKSFWREEINIDMPKMEGLGSSKFVFIHKS
ncbi:MAG: TylF/MycF family methyltransferase [Patescibacteria group bacterium]|nr:TylF/MycF family methyltransferase [Patescibacteria group bacterium]MCL5224082.1 TylF/MycF family methyltransferase [Patescibacteria group bacterium]